MYKKRNISNVQIKNLLVTTIIGVGILSLPNSMAAILDNDGWIGILLGGILLIPFIIMLDKLFKWHPNKSIFEIGREVLGNVVFTIFSIILLGYVVILLSFTVRIFGEVIKAYLLERTPIEVVIITMLLSVSYASRSGIEVLGRTATMIYPILIALIVFLILINLPDADFTNILPVFNTDLTKFPKGILVSLYSYAGYEVLVLSYPLSDDRKNTLKYAIRAIFIVIGIYLITFIIALSQLGIAQLKREIWPTISIANKVDLPGYFLENLDGVVLSLWVIVVYATIAPVLYFGGKALESLFKTKSHDLFIFPLMIIIYAISLIPDNIIAVYKDMSKLSDYFTITTIMVMPTLLFIIGWIKRRRSNI